MLTVSGFVTGATFGDFICKRDCQKYLKAQSTSKMAQTLFLLTLLFFCSKHAHCFTHKQNACHIESDQVDTAAAETEGLFVLTVRGAPSQSFCVNEPFVFAWKNLPLYTSPDELPIGWGIGLFEDNAAGPEQYLQRWPFPSNTYHSLRETAKEVARWSEAKYTQAISCEESSSDEYSSCKEAPRLVKVIAAPTYIAGTTVSLVFDRPTSRPDLPPERLFRFSGGSLGCELSGEWMNAKEYVIEVLNSSGHSNYHDPDSPLMIDILRTAPTLEKVHWRRSQWLNHTLRDLQVISHTGNVSVSLGFAARVHFRIYQADLFQETATFIYKSKDIRVDSCGIPPPLQREPSRLLPPKWHLKGPLALDGRFIPKVRLSTAEDAPFWFEYLSVNMNIFLPSRHGVYQDEEMLSLLLEKEQMMRAIFYHGEGVAHESGDRTPSLWILPESNRITLRVSTNKSVDEGWESELSLPTDQWIALQVEIQNRSDGYAAVVTVDDITFLQINSTSVLLPSRGLFHVGQDAWGSGQAMFLSEVYIRDSVEQRPFVANSQLRHNPLHTIHAMELDRELNLQVLKEALYSSEHSPARVTELIELAADDGHADALFARAAVGMCGISCWRQFEKVRTGNHSINTGVDLRGQDSSMDTMELATLLQRSVLLGSSSAMFVLGLLIHFGVVHDRAQRSYTPQQLMLESSMRGNRLAKFWLAHFGGEDEVTALIYEDLSSVSQTLFHRRGEEPFVEHSRLSDYLEIQGEGGEDDSLIEYDQFRADHGDVNAMNAMASRYYWGKNGVQRDQATAFRWFEKAGALGHAPSMTACGNMLLKGEGVDKNVPQAINWYEKAIKQDELSAMNGLGFIHFFGNGNITANTSRALHYFSQNLRDGDSLFNAAYILLRKESSQYNYSLALAYLDRAANRFGSFDAAKTLGEVYLYGHGMHFQRDIVAAIPLLRSVALRGVWGQFSRIGFEHFMKQRFDSAFFSYLIAAALGYDHALGNVVWLRMNREARLIGRSLDVERWVRSLSKLPQYAPEANLYLGNLLYDTGDTHNALKSWIVAGSKVRECNHDKHQGYNLNSNYDVLYLRRVTGRWIL